VYLLRQESSGAAQRTKIDLKGIASQDDSVPDGVNVTLRNGDKIYVPTASQYIMVGEVRKPESYRLESGLTVERAIALAGGVTDKGSASRIEIKRRKPNGDYQILSGKLNDKIQPNDTIRVKERIF
jgi:polysaccharide export outer membrane protein